MRSSSAFRCTVALTVAVALLVAGAGCKRGDETRSGVGPFDVDGAASAPLAAGTSSAPAVGSAKPVSGIPMTVEMVAGVVNPSHLPSYEGPTGSVEGTILIHGELAPAVTGKKFANCPGAAATRGRLFSAGAPGPNGDRPVANAIVAVTGYSGYFLPERKDAYLLKVDRCDSVPQTIAMTFGQRLEIANTTKELIAPSLEQFPTPALMVAAPNSEAVKLYITRPGHFTLVDRLGNDYLQADVYALLHPLHAVSDAAGHFRIDGVPVGKLRVSARLAAISQEASQEVDVLAGVVQHVDLTLTYAAASDAGVSAAPRGAEPKTLLR